MAKRGVKSSMLTNVPPELRAAIDADLVMLFDHPGREGDGRPRNIDDIHARHALEQFGVSRHALARYARGVEEKHRLSLSASIAEAVASERDIVPEARKILAARLLERVLDGELKTEDLAGIAGVVDRYARTDLAEAALRQQQLEAALKRLSSNDAVKAFVAACEIVFGDEWKSHSDEVLRVMDEQLKAGTASTAR